MSRFYISLNTLKVFLENDNAGFNSIADILTLVGKACEFKEIRLKHSEKRFYKEMNKLPGIKYPIKGDIKENWHKISLICQFELGGGELPNYNGAQKLYSSFQLDKMIFFKSVQRVVKFFVDCFAALGKSQSLRYALELSRCVAGKCWKESPVQLRQLEGVGVAYVRKLVSHGIKSIYELSKLDHQTIERNLSVGLARSSKIKKDSSNLPQLNVDMKAVTTKNGRLNLMVTVCCENGVACKFWHKSLVIVDIVTETSFGNLLDFRRM